MRSSLYHLQLNINWDNVGIYKDLMAFLGWGVIFEKPRVVIGFRSYTNGDVWFCQRTKHLDNDYDGSGMNHVAIRVEKQQDIDTVTNFLTQHHIVPLFETPRHRPEFTSKPGETYYQVMFKSPDNLLFEIVYIGQKRT